MPLAQLKLIYNKDVAVDDIKRTDVNFDSPSSLADEKSAAKSFAHPYYWAPFVLIGNGL
ncbi:MAG: hypothetical protein KI793_27225 [Rivularia sp. (in: Bacteria)]|nr:hypothetical protein [Rivularia sp. MS3]